jgi:hypothetical protein
MAGFYSETEYAEVAKECDALRKERDEVRIIADTALSLRRDEFQVIVSSTQRKLDEYRLTAEREVVATKFANEQLFKMRDDRDRWKQLRMDALDALSFWQAELAHMWTKGAWNAVNVPGGDVGAAALLGERALQFEALANKLAAKQGRNKPAVLNG